MHEDKSGSSSKYENTPALTDLPSWKALLDHYEALKNEHLRDLFAQSENRFDNFSIPFSEQFLVDFSKNRVTEQTLELLINLAEESSLQEWIQRMYRGDAINNTERRSVLHVALRNRSNTPILVDGQDVMPEINRVLDHMERFCVQVQSGEWKGYTGKPIRNIVNIGIGGSDLGPFMVTTALQPYMQPGLNAHYVSNVDGTDISETLEKIDPETCLFIIASKTFTTKETMANAETARNWFLQHEDTDESHIKQHFVAVSTNAAAVETFGIDTANMFEFWEWVGGRYSLWSAIGLSIALCVGMDRFKELLQGAHEMDKHFYNAPFRQNIPVILGLIGIWYRNFFQASNHAILPYDHSLRLLPLYLQQADMESNGKSVTRDGKPISYNTGPIIWGAPGTNGQHAFFQLIHQGTELIPSDFILPIRSKHPLGHHQKILIANCLAQAEALMGGRTAEETVGALADEGVPEDMQASLTPHKTFPGNQPSNMILVDELTPQNLGSLIAMYEHKIFVQGIIWQIDSFDQWGVELGKQLANVIEPELKESQSSTQHDSSTNGLINYCRKHQ